jgi:hypothetical protein
VRLLIDIYLSIYLYSLYSNYRLFSAYLFPIYALSMLDLILTAHPAFRVDQGELTKEGIGNF